MIPRRVRLGLLLGAVLHGFLVLSGQYRLSFDAYNHMFFADHYRLGWWTLWEPRWYTGFSITSYPPLVHQIIGLLAHLIGLDAAFALVLWIMLALYPLAAYVFSRIFSGAAVAGYAALGAAVLPSIYLAAHNFGQLPTLVATLFALFGLATLADFLRHGNILSGALALALFAVVMAAHHATLLFMPWAVAGIFLHLFLNDKTNRPALVGRLAIFTPLAAVVGLVVIWPFWAWGLGQGIQVPIDHPTRHNFLTDSFAVIAFFLPIYGPFMPVIPFIFWKSLQRRFAGPGLAFAGLFVLGLGGTTPLPRWLFGAGWEWLTYDRFAFWASLLLLPFFGTAILLLRRWLPNYLGFHLDLRLDLSKTSQSAWLKTLKAAWPGPRRWAAPLFLAFASLVAATIGLLPSWMPFEPRKIDMQPIVAFLAEDDHAQWRYLTFGFGDQMALLSTLTTATTIDGSYHTARSLPELRESGIAQIDTVYWTVKGLPALDPILQESGEHGVRWGFLNVKEYIPVLERNGWIKRSTLSNGIQLWENPAAILPDLRQHPTEDSLASFSWGIFPLFSLALAGVLAGLRLRPGPTQRALQAAHWMAIGLLPVALCFWYYRKLAQVDVAGIYFTYTDSLFFLGDALALIAILSWGLVHLFGSRDNRPTGHSPLTRWLLALCLLASASTFWSPDWRVTLYASLHLWLAFGLFLSVQGQPQTWRAFAIGSCAALVLQILFGFAQFAVQSTAFLQPLGLDWPGAVEPAIRGTSVVQLADGMRWLRVYGSLPHPNLLGGFVVAFLLGGPATLFCLSARRQTWALVLFSLGTCLLVLTFSRGAWLGLAAGMSVLALQRLKLDHKRLLALGLSGLVGALLAGIPLFQLVFTRVGGAQVSTEQFSVDARLWLVRMSLEMIKAHPLLGTGMGAFLLDYGRHAPLGYLIEPVHNLPLLIVVELGMGGGIILVGMGIVLVRHSLKAHHPGAILACALLAGLLVEALFDHYLWTAAAGRILLGLVLGLWASRISGDAEAQK